VRADVTQLQQVLVNLVVNARDAMPDGGTVVIETNICSGDEGRQAVLQVSDAGSGMSLETQARIFEPFFTTKARGQGTGLGLSIVHGIVAQSSGTIEVDSTLGSGTEVRVRFPLISLRPSSTDSESATATVAPDAPSATVLLVEDEAPVRNAARRMLERAGHTVVEAQHAEDALVLWRRDQERFDVLVTDLMMPGMDGWTLLRMLREDRPSLPAVVVSGYTGTSGADQSSNDSAVTLRLAKPFGARELAESVQNALEQSLPA
jgi:two-component system cell cycle sensor histidine kinase/response regulator CckA